MLETRVKMNNATKVRKRFENDWNQLDNCEHHPNDIIWVMWKNENMDIKPSECSNQFLSCEVYNIEGKRQYWMTVVHAHNQLTNKRKLWMDIKQQTSNIQE